MPVLDDPDILRTWKQLLCILFCMLGRNTIATQQAIQVVRRAWDLISGQFDTSYYNKFGQESRAASPAFFPSHA